MLKIRGQRTAGRGGAPAGSFRRRGGARRSGACGPGRPLANRDGFTLILVMAVVVILGISLGLTGQSWRMIMKREREKELLFRGSQIKEAIESFRKQNVTTVVNDLSELVRYRSPSVRPLRRLYNDPMTGKPDWRLIRDQYGIKGVASSSQEKPVKVSFSNISSLSTLTGKKKYSEWEFVQDPANDHSRTFNAYHEDW